MERREDHRELGTLVKDELTKLGKNPVDLRTENEPSSFYAAIGEAKQNNEHGAFVAQHLAETMANIRAGVVSETKSLNIVDSVENVAYNTEVGGKANGTGL